jgi:phosphatidylserine/phosphatidylglycerophosphate/cardiolipin synthase-like enzyme
MNAPSLTSIADLAFDIRHARHVELEAYILKNPLLLYSLETAAGNGADVTVRLGDPVDLEQRATNRAAAQALSSAGVQVEPEAGYGPKATHAKVAVVDDRVYFDDRNFTANESETILVARRGAASRDYIVTKAKALLAEARFIKNAAGHDLLVSTESLGPSPVLDALLERARSGDRVRVMYDGNTSDRACAEAVAALRSAGAEVRPSHENHKIAVADGTAWIGSANASPGAGEQREWGMVLQNDPAVRLRDTLDYCWRTAKAPLDAAHSSLHGHPRA